MKVEFEGISGFATFPLCLLHTRLHGLPSTHDVCYLPDSWLVSLAADSPQDMNVYIIVNPLSSGMGQFKCYVNAVGGGGGHIPRKKALHNT